MYAKEGRTHYWRKKWLLDTCLSDGQWQRLRYCRSGAFLVKGRARDAPLLAFLVFDIYPSRLGLGLNLYEGLLHDEGRLG